MNKIEMIRSFLVGDDAIDDEQRRQRMAIAHDVNEYFLMIWSHEIGIFRDKLIEALLNEVFSEQGWQFDNINNNHDKEGYIQFYREEWRPKRWGLHLPFAGYSIQGANSLFDNLYYGIGRSSIGNEYYKNTKSILDDKFKGDEFWVGSKHFDDKILRYTSSRQFRMKWVARKGREEVLSSYVKELRSLYDLTIDPVNRDFEQYIRLYQ